MTRLIDTDALRAWFSDHSVYDEFPVGYIMGLLDDQPTVDAVPVIRCKDCKFATITDGVYGRNQEVKYCDIWFPSEAEYMPIDYYCASAERKEE